MDDVTDFVVSSISFVAGVYLCRKLFSPGPLIGPGSYKEPTLMRRGEREDICLHMVYAFKMCSKQKRGGLADFNCDNIYDRLRHFCGTEFDPLDGYLQK